ncbi:ABC transporter ATP-binding protein [Alkaliphilus crotonatoxidans]
MFRLKEDRRIIKWLLSLFKPYSRKLIIVIVCVMASAGINILLPLVSRELMDNGLLKSDIVAVIRLAALTISLVVIDQGIGLLETKYRAYISSMLPYNLRNQAFKHLLKLKISYFNQKNFAETLNTIEADVANISKISDRSMFFVVTSIFKMLGGVIGLTIIDWRLTLLILLIIPFRFFIVKYLSKKRRALYIQYMQSNREYSAWFGDTVGGIKEIKLWGIDGIKIGEFVKKQRNIVKLNIKMAFMDKMNELSEMLIHQIIINTLTVMGALLAFNYDLTIGGVFAFITFSVYVTQPISAILNVAYSFSSILPSAKRHLAFLTIEQEASQAEYKEIGAEIGGNIKFENVSFAYDQGETVLKDISFEIKGGEKVAIIGANGSGKTTIINLLLRFYQPLEGRILLDGLDIKEINLKDYRKMIGVVNQEVYLFNTSIKKNIALFSSLDASKIERAARESGAEGFIDLLPHGYESITGRNGAQLSGGERQKIAVARALARNSKILIFDEATSNYDLESENYLNNILATGIKNKTMILITHKTEVLKHVDRILLIEAGTVIEVGSYDALKKNYKKYMESLNQITGKVNKVIS